MLLAVMREVGGAYKVAYKTTRRSIYCLAYFETARNNGHKADPRGNGQRGIMFPRTLVHCRTMPVNIVWVRCTYSLGEVSSPRVPPPLALYQDASRRDSVQKVPLCSSMFDELSIYVTSTDLHGKIRKIM